MRWVLLRLCTFHLMQKLPTSPQNPPAMDRTARTYVSVRGATRICPHATLMHRHDHEERAILWRQHQRRVAARVEEIQDLLNAKELCIQELLLLAAVVQ